jgi:hypothetical protein
MQLAKGALLCQALSYNALFLLQESLCSQLQQLPPLSNLPPAAQVHHFPLPPSGSRRLAAARQAHALALAEARVGSQWWVPLRLLNQQQQRAAVAGAVAAGVGPTEGGETAAAAGAGLAAAETAGTAGAGAAAAVSGTAAGAPVAGAVPACVAKGHTEEELSYWIGAQWEVQEQQWREAWERLRRQEGQRPGGVLLAAGV